jgi:hypothetical protein
MVCDCAKKTWSTSTPRSVAIMSLSRSAQSARKVDIVGKETWLIHDEYSLGRMRVKEIASKRLLIAV